MKLHKMIVENNEMLFNQFLDFPKPILVAANGPSIGAAVTSALLCDGGGCHLHHNHWTGFHLQESWQAREPPSSPLLSNSVSPLRAAAVFTSKGRWVRRRLINSWKKELRLMHRKRWELVRFQIYSGSLITSYISVRVCSRSCSSLLLVIKVADCCGELDQRGTNQNNTRWSGCWGVQNC